MSAARGVYEYIRDNLQDANAALTVGVGTLVVNAVAGDALSVYPTDSLCKKALLAYPSAFPADEVFGNQLADTAFQATYAAASVGLARSTTSKEGTVYTALGAQGLACGVNTMVEWAGLVPESEKTRRDVGFSSVFSALTNKFLLDKWFEAKAKGETAESRRYLGALVLLDSGLTAGAYYVEKGQGGALVLASHAAGIAAGAASHRFGKFRKKVQQDRAAAKLATNYAAT